MLPHPRLFEIDSRSLAVCRIALGMILLTDLAIRSTALQAHYSDVGVVPSPLWAAQQADTWRWSLLRLSDSVVWRVGCFVAAALAAACLTIGYRTRIATVGCWVLWVSIQSRNPLILNGGDTLLRMLLFWSMFLPLANVWSIDCRRSATSRDAQTLPIRSWASAAILLQICLMYSMAGYYKIVGGWLAGTELNEVLHYDSYARPLAHHLRDFPRLMTVSGFAVVAMELVGPWLLIVSYRWWRLRCATIVGLMLIHLGIELTFTVGLFSYVSWAGLLLFLPAELWNRISATVVADDAPRAEQGEPPSHGSLPSRVSHLATSGLVVAAASYVGWWNFAGTRSHAVDAPVPGLASRFGDLFYLQQKWNLFGTVPPADGWYVVLAELRDGEAVDLLRDGARADWDSYTKPDYIYRRNPDHRWRKLYQNLIDERYDMFRETLCEYLAAQWNQTHPVEEHATRIELQYMRETDDEQTFIQEFLQSVDVTTSSRRDLRK